MPLSTSTLRPEGSGFSASDWEALSRFWHPIALSGEVTGAAPFGTVLLDLRLVVFRDREGVACVALDICPHRGAQLSRGWARNGQLICPYHGFHFEGDGRCALIPANGPDAPIPDRIRLTRFETIERHGIIWTRLAAEEAAPPPDWSALEAPEIVSASLPPETWAVAAARHAENFNDITHLAWVHAETFGALPPEAPDYALEIGETALRHWYHDIGGERLFQRHVDAGDAAAEMANAAIENVLFDYRFAFPFASSLTIAAPDGRRVMVFDVIQPMARKSSRVFKIVARDFDESLPMDTQVAFERRVNQEDREVIEPALPVEVPLDPRDERHIKADRWSVAYRRGLGRFGLGQGVDRVTPD